MKKLIILMVVLMLTAGLVGCKCDWCRKGALFSHGSPQAPVYEPCPQISAYPPTDACAPAYDPCAPGSYTAPPGILPGPGSATPGQ